MMNKNLILGLVLCCCVLTVNAQERDYSREYSVFQNAQRQLEQGNLDEAKRLAETLPNEDQRVCIEVSEERKKIRGPGGVMQWQTTSTCSRYGQLMVKSLLTNIGSEIQKREAASAIPQLGVSPRVATVAETPVIKAPVILKPSDIALEARLIEGYQDNVLDSLEPFSLAISIKNNSREVLKDVKVIVMPSPANYVESTTREFQVGELAAGSSSQVDFDSSLSRLAKLGTLKFEVMLEAENLEGSSISSAEQRVRN